MIIKLLKKVKNGLKIIKMIEKFERIKNNCLLAIFDGYEFVNERWLYAENNGFFVPFGTVEEIRYDSTHNWYIMSVVDKIEKLGYNVIIVQRSCVIAGGEPDILGATLRINNDGDTKIEAVWRTCGEFVEFYNKNLK